MTDIIFGIIFLIVLFIVGFNINTKPKLCVFITAIPLIAIILYTIYS